MTAIFIIDNSFKSFFQEKNVEHFLVPLTWLSLHVALLFHVIIDEISLDSTADGTFVNQTLCWLIKKLIGSAETC